MCKSKADGGQRCTGIQARVKHALGMTHESDIPAPRSVRNAKLCPDQVGIIEDRFGKAAAVAYTFRRDLVLDDGKVVEFNPATHSVTEGAPTSMKDAAARAKHGVVMVVNQSTGAYVVYRAQEQKSGEWKISTVEDSGLAVEPSRQAESGFATRL